MFDPEEDEVCSGVRRTQMPEDSVLSDWLMQPSERELLTALYDLRERYGDNYAIESAAIVPFWLLLKIVACLPVTDEDMRKILGPHCHIDFINDCVDEVRKSLGMPSLRPTRDPVDYEGIEDWVVVF